MVGKILYLKQTVLICWVKFALNITIEFDIFKLV